MKQLPNHLSLASKRAPGQQARAQTVVLLAIFFLLGIAVSAFWFYTTAKPGPAGGGGQSAAPAGRLSEGTRAALRRLRSPLEIRYYALLDAAVVPESLVAFAGRVDQMLSAYEQAGGGQVKVTRFTGPASANTAEAEGLDAFNAEQGHPCYLGLTLVLKGKQETLPRLSPEWEPALEPDVTRAISRLLEAGAPVVAPRIPTAVYTNAAQEVKALIPDLSAVSIEEGKRIIQEAALKDFTAAAKEMETQIKAAEQQLSQVQTSGSAADKEAAVQHLQQIQRDQSRKLKEIGLKAKAQADALQQLKAAPR